MGKASPRGSWQQAEPSYIISDISESLPHVGPTPQLSGSSFPTGSFIPAWVSETHELEEGVDELPRLVSVPGWRLAWGPAALRHGGVEFLRPCPPAPGRSNF